MPYANPDDRRAAQARWYREKLARDRKFRHDESDRKAAWLQTDEGKASNAEATRRHRKKATGNSESASHPVTKKPRRKASPRGRKSP